MNRREFITLAPYSVLLSTWLISQQTKYSDIFNQIIEKAQIKDWGALPISELFVNVASEFIDFPYLGGTLDVDNNERCIVTFEGFDCFTFFEVSLGFARIIKKRRFTFQDLVDEVAFTRYRGGRILDYASRLHYSSDWIYDNILKGVVQDRTAKLGGRKVTFQVSYMSENPHLYKQLKEDKIMLSKIKAIEQEIKKRSYYVISKRRFRSVENYLANGNIVFIATSKKGLDYSHIGICVVKNGAPRLLHASSKLNRVVLDKPISLYLEENKTASGVTIVELLEP